MDSDHEVAARTIAGEADDQPELGQRAIAHVIINRLRTRRWGETIFAVCLWPEQFSCWWDRSDCERILSILRTDPRLPRFAQFVDDALGAADPTKGALNYKRTSLSWPADWGPVALPQLTVGAHSFYILKEQSYER